VRRGDPRVELREGGLTWPAIAVVVAVGWWTARLSVAEAPWCFLDYVNLAFHEAGHLVFTPLGSTMHFLGGTLGQLIVPVGLVFYFVLKQKSLGAAFCSWWTGESLVNVARYMADARELELPLVGGGEHDWNELFFRFGLLGQGPVEAISTWTHRLGVLLMLAGVAWCGYSALPPSAREAIRDRIARRAPRGKGIRLGVDRIERGSG
jgi:hypothetical protein